MAPLKISLAGGTVHVRVYSDVCDRGADVETVVSFADSQVDFPYIRTGRTDATLSERRETSNEIYGLTMFATVETVVSSGEHLRTERAILFMAIDAAAGALFKASSRFPVVSALTRGLRGAVAQLSTARLVGGAQSAATPADEPNRIKEPYL